MAGQLHNYQAQFLSSLQNDTNTNYFGDPLQPFSVSNQLDASESNKLHRDSGSSSNERSQSAQSAPLEEESSNFTCEHCNRKFLSRNCLCEHLRNTHDVKKSYVCPEQGCDASYQKGISLDSHLRTIHNKDIKVEEKKYKLVKGKWICNVCDKVFKGQSAVSNHQHTHDEPTFTCSYCPKKFHLKAHLKTHEKNLHGNDAKLFTGAEDGLIDEPIRNHFCENCGKGYSSKFSLQRHVVEVHNKDSCNHCLRNFKSDKDLSYHLKETHDEEQASKLTDYSTQYNEKFDKKDDNDKSDKCENEKLNSKPKPKENIEDNLIRNHLCENCGKRYCSKYALNIHVLKTHTDNSCSHCLRNFNHATELLYHLKQSHDEKPPTELIKRVALLFRKESSQYLCEYCSKTYTSLDKFNKHILIHREEELKSKCPICLIQFGTKKEIELHIEKDHKDADITKIVPLSLPKCKFCEKTFADEIAVKLHENKIHGCKEKICPFCSKIFSHRSKAGFSGHIRSHLGFKPYQCTHCDQAFTQKSNMMLHVKVHHFRNNPLYCRLCDVLFVTKENHQEHMNEKHFGKNKFECQICHWGTDDVYKFTRHKRHSHQNEISHAFKAHVCEFCMKKYTKRSILREHYRKCEANIEKKKPPPLPRLKKQIPPTKNVKDISVTEEFLCNKCYFVFASHEECAAHCKSVHSFHENITIVINRSDAKTKFNEADTFISNESNRFFKKARFFCKVCHVFYALKNGYDRHVEGFHPNLKSKIVARKPSSISIPIISDAADSEESRVHEDTREKKSKKELNEDSESIISLCTDVCIDDLDSCDEEANNVNHNEPKGPTPDFVQCQFCKKLHSCVAKLEKHFAKHHPNEKFKFDEKTTQTFNRETSSDEEEFNSDPDCHLDGPACFYQCSMCKKLLDSETELRQHREKQHPKQNNKKSDDPDWNERSSIFVKSKAKVPNHKSKAKVPNHKSKAKVNPNLSCKFCFQHFKKLSYLTQHISKHHGSKQQTKKGVKNPRTQLRNFFICKICEIPYSTRDGISSHLRKMHKDIEMPKLPVENFEEKLKDYIYIGNFSELKSILNRKAKSKTTNIVTNTEKNTNNDRSSIEKVNNNSDSTEEIKNYQSSSKRDSNDQNTIEKLHSSYQSFSEQITSNDARFVEKITSDNQTSIEKVTSDLCSAEKVTSDLCSAEKVTPDLCSAEKVTPDLCSAEKVTPDLCSAEKVTPDLCSAEKVTPDLCSAEKVTPDLCSVEKVTPDRCSVEKVTSEECPPHVEIQSILDTAAIDLNASNETFMVDLRNQFINSEKYICNVCKFGWASQHYLEIHIDKFHPDYYDKYSNEKPSTLFDNVVQDALRIMLQKESASCVKEIETPRKKETTNTRKKYCHDYRKKVYDSTEDDSESNVETENYSSDSNSSEEARNLRPNSQKVPAQKGENNRINSYQTASTLEPEPSTSKSPDHALLLSTPVTISSNPQPMVTTNTAQFKEMVETTGVVNTNGEVQNMLPLSRIENERHGTVSDPKISYNNQIYNNSLLSLNQYSSVNQNPVFPVPSFGEHLEPQTDWESIFTSPVKNQNTPVTTANLNTLNPASEHYARNSNAQALGMHQPDNTGLLYLNRSLTMPLTGLHQPHLNSNTETTSLLNQPIYSNSVFPNQLNSLASVSNYQEQMHAPSSSTLTLLSSSSVAQCSRKDENHNVADVVSSSEEDPSNGQDTGFEPNYDSEISCDDPKEKLQKDEIGIVASKMGKKICNTLKAAKNQEKCSEIVDDPLIKAQCNQVPSSKNKKNHESDGALSPKKLEEERSKVLFCTKCPAYYKLDSGLLFHYKRDHPECVDIISNLEKQLVQSKGRRCGKLYICEFCPKKWATRSLLANHVKSRHTERRFPCNLCNEVFIANHALTLHLETHKEKGEYKCTLCTDEFRTEDALKKHRITHNKVYPFDCQNCERGFSSEMKLKSHAENDCEKKFACPDCELTFETRESFREHCDEHVKIKIECPKCQLKFKRMLNLEYHVKFKVCEGGVKARREANKKRQALEKKNKMSESEEEDGETKVSSPRVKMSKAEINEKAPAKKRARKQKVSSESSEDDDSDGSKELSDASVIPKICRPSRACKPQSLKEVDLDD